MRMLAIDMDGTCLNNKHRISGKTMTALQEAATAGIEIVPTTGSALSCLPHQLRNCKYIRYVISSNGAVVSDLHTGQMIFKEMIPCDTASTILDACGKAGVGITAHIKNESIVEGKVLAALGRLSYGPDASRNICVQSISKHLEERREDIEEIQLFLFSHDSSDKVLEILKGYKGITAVAAPKYIEIFSENATKGNAVAALCAHLGIRTDQVACIGDGENDLSMFEKCGMTFAMANGIPKLKNAADHIVPSNNKHGVAVAIQEYLL